MAKATSPVHLQKTLIDAATLSGQQFHRSAAEQIEYWADLGRRMAGVLNPLELAELLAGISTLKLEPALCVPLDIDAVFAKMQYSRVCGELAAAVTTTYPRYQAAISHPGYLEQINADGTRTVGMFSNGVFSTQKP